ncbi:MAG: peptidoglycan-binding domain-containing protein [Pseudomonadota bacterium]
MHAHHADRLHTTANEVEPAGPIVQSIIEHRYLALGALVSLIMMTVIIINAVWFQEGRHPAPLFATRTVDGVRPIAVEDDKRQAAKPATGTQVANLNDDGNTDMSRELVREVQSVLAARGYYKGKIDGLYGNRTRRAIVGFQRDHSMAQSGRPSWRLVTQVLMSKSARPNEVPIPKQSDVVNVPINKVKTIALSTAPKKEPVSGLIARIQKGLRAYGYEDLTVDGKMGQQTATAIQRFQLDYGMKITGEPSERVLKKLKSIGAYTSG